MLWSGSRSAMMPRWQARSFGSSGTIANNECTLTPPLPNMRSKLPGARK